MNHQVGSCPAVLTVVLNIGEDTEIFHKIVQPYIRCVCDVVIRVTVLLVAE